MAILLLKALSIAIQMKVNTVFEELVPGIDHNAYKITVFPSAEGRNTRICKVIFDDYDTKMAISNNTSKLRNIEDIKRLFIRWDEPRYTRLENSRLRTRRYNLSREFPDDDIKIKKGILYHNNTQCEKFDLMNQIF